MKTHIEQTETSTSPTASDVPDNANPAKKLGTMLGGPRGYDERAKNRYYAQKRKSNKARYDKKPRRDNEPSRNKRPYYHQDSDSDARERVSDDERRYDARYNPKRSGKRRDYNNSKNRYDRAEQERKPEKKVRFADQHDDQDEEDYTNGDSYFRDQVQPRSSRT